MKTKPIYIFIPVFLMFTSCIEKEYYYVSESIKSWILFQPGSYWIYKNDTGALDSTIVTKVSDMFINNVGRVSIEQDYLEDQYSQIIIMEMARYLKFDSNKKDFDSILIIKDFIGRGDAGRDYNERDLGGPTYFSNSQYSGYYPVFNVDGNSYYNVIRHKFFDPNHNWYFYIARRYGIIMSVEYNDTLNSDSTIWKLLRYKIIQ